jgi:glycosyltransferase involved in cell wall biosynthesis
VKSPETIYSIATRLGTAGLGTVSYNELKALDESGFLKLAVTYGNRSDLRDPKIISLPGNPAKLLFFLSRRYYRPLRNGFLDYVTSRIILAKGCGIFHGWNNQALKSIRAAHKIGAKTIIESGTTHWLYRSRLLKEEYKKFGIEHLKTPEYAMRSSIEEIDRSDFVFLPSEFAKKTFIASGTDENKIFVMGRGVDLEGFTPGPKKDKKFRVLFAGRLSLRKGVHYLLEAWENLKLKDAELILAGGIDDNLKPVLSRYTHLRSIVLKGFIKDPGQVQKVFKEATIFVLPSLEEGSAKVTYEAMASGLPVITTENSGSVVRHGLDGFIIPIKDSKAIQERILYYYDNPEMIEVMGNHGTENVKLYTWKKYRDTLIDVYKRLPGI